MEIQYHEDVSPEFRKVLKSVLNDCKRKHSVLYSIATQRDPTLKTLQELPKITVHSPEIPRSSYSTIKYVPEQHRIHVFPPAVVNKEELKKQALDTIARIAYSNLLNHITTGKRSLLKQVPKISDENPLTTHEQYSAIKPHVDKRISDINVLKQLLLETQASAIKDKDNLHYRHRNLLSTAKIKPNTLNNNIHAPIIYLLKKLSGHGILSKKLKQLQKYPAFAPSVARLYTFLQDSYLRH